MKLLKPITLSFILSSTHYYSYLSKDFAFVSNSFSIVGIILGFSHAVTKSVIGLFIYHVDGTIELFTSLFFILAFNLFLHGILDISQ